MSLAILNGFGRVLGDTLIGYQALEAALAAGVAADPVVFRLPGLGPMVEQVHEAASVFCTIRDLPWEDATRERPFGAAADFQRVADCRDLAFDPEYLSHHDLFRYFVERLGMTLRTVPPARRRIAWLRPRVRPCPPPGLPDRYILVCPQAAMALRTMPDDVHAMVCAVAGQFAPVVTQAERPLCARLEELCGLVEAARLVVSTDTAMVHLADAMAVPCLAFFPTHDPALRIAAYPACLGVRLPADLPPNLEFARGQADVTAAHAAWPRDPDEVAGLIAQALAM